MVYAGFSVSNRYRPRAPDPSVKAAAPEPVGEGLLHSFLQGRDVPCPLCGYNLRDLTAQRCPECGTGLMLQVGLTEPRLGWFITLLTACCTGFGGSLLFSLIALKAAPPGWWLIDPTAIFLLAQLALTGILLPVIVRGRSRFRRMTNSKQKALAVVLCVAVAVFWLCIVLSFRK